MEVNDVLTYSYTGAAQPVDLPPGKFRLECWGAQGGGAVGGKGGYAVGELELHETSTVTIYVGQQSPGRVGGWNGGGGGGGAYDQTGGGGASDIRLGGIELTNRIIVAGGGGGRGSNDNRANGHGGGLTGVTANASGSTPGTGGTQIAGGVNGGTLGQGGSGSSQGGGGGGYYGGGAGISIFAGGGGGSGYLDNSLTNAYMETGVRTGNGLIQITVLELGGEPTDSGIIFATFI